MRLFLEREEIPSDLLQYFEPVDPDVKPDIWTIATAPYKGAHFATFPQALVEPCILAGTSERGCCPKCGKPWERIVEKGLTAHDGDTETIYPKGTTANRLALLRQAARERGEEYVNTTTTTGWRPGCECMERAQELPIGEAMALVADTWAVPCTVLDPFVGSGTMCLVSERLGRDSIGIDLNLEYVNGLAEQRVAVVQPLLLETGESW